MSSLVMILTVVSPGLYPTSLRISDPLSHHSWNTKSANILEPNLISSMEALKSRIKARNFRSIKPVWAVQEYDIWFMPTQGNRFLAAASFLQLSSVDTSVSSTAELAGSRLASSWSKPKLSPPVPPNELVPFWTSIGRKGQLGTVLMKSIWPRDLDCLWAPHGKSLRDPY